MSSERRTESVDRTIHSVITRSADGRRLRRLVVDCPRGQAKDLSACWRCQDCHGYTLLGADGVSTVTCAVDAVTPTAGLVSGHMSRDVLCVRANVPLKDVVAVLAEAHLHGLPVVDENDRPVGVITQSDIVRTVRKLGLQGPGRGLLQAIESAFDPDSLPVETNDKRVHDAMTPDVATTRETATLRGAAQQMAAGDIHRLVVVDEEGRVVGVLAALDVARAFAAGA